MSSRPKTTATDRRSGGARRSGKGATARQHRAQVRAMEARAAATAEAPPPTVEAARSPTERSVAPSVRWQSGRRAARQAVVRPVALTPEQEFAYVRADLRRMVLTFAVLLAVMIALLLVIE